MIIKNPRLVEYARLLAGLCPWGRTGLVYRTVKIGDQQSGNYYIPNPIFGPEAVGDPEVHSGLPLGVK